ncbi:MAG: hypothetical protein ABIL20_04475 [candidate division WOR-3 bacterium]
MGFYVQEDSFSFYLCNAVCFSYYDHLVYVFGDTSATTSYSWTEDTWYEVRAVIDYEQLLMDVWIDTVQIINDLRAVPQNTSKTFVLCTELYSDCITLYDNVNISGTP